MEAFLVRDEGPRLNPYLLFAFILSLGIHILVLLPRWLASSPLTPAHIPAPQINFEIQLSSLPQTREEEAAATGIQDENPGERAHELLNERHEEPAPVAERVEPQPAPEPQPLNMGRSIQKAFEDIRSAEQDYRLPGSSGRGTSAFDPNWSERIKASERFNQDASSAQDSFTSFSDSSGAEIVEMSNGNCFRVETTSNLGGERAWIHVPCGVSRRLRLKPESHLDQVGPVDQ